MEILIATAVLAFFLKRAVVDIGAMTTGRTPPSHAYRMAKLRQKRDIEKDPDTREGAKKILRHWYLDACEDVDAWRANRRLTKPQRKAAKAKRKQRRRDVIAAAKQRAKEGTRKATQRLRRNDPAVDEVPVPEVPDNVIPLERARKNNEKEDSTDAPGNAEPGEQPPSEGGQKSEEPGGAVSAETDTPSTDQAGLIPHLAALNSARQRCDRIIANVDRIRAQMESSGVGSQVTGEAGPATDAARSAEQQLGSAAGVLERINQKVLEQLDASQHQAGDKHYVEPENSGNAAR